MISDEMRARLTMLFWTEFVRILEDKFAESPPQLMIDSITHLERYAFESARHSIVEYQRILYMLISYLPAIIDQYLPLYPGVDSGILADSSSSEHISLPSRRVLKPDIITFITAINIREFLDIDRPGFLADEQELALKLESSKIETRTSTARTCPKCAKSEVTIIIGQTRGGDEGNTIIYTCKFCKFTFK
jgi:DNA-directed RNA polymerase subunit M/transcription elongation factor TFIIS